MILLRVGAALGLAAALAGCAGGSRSASPADTVRADAEPAQASVQAATKPGAAESVGGWQEIAPGVEARRFTWEDQGGKSPVVALRVSPDRVHVAVGAPAPGLEAPAWRARERALAAFNGGFFDAEGRSLGARVSGGRLASKTHGTSWSVFRVKGAGAASEAKIISAAEFDAALKRGVRYQDAVQCGPRLVSAGRVGVFKDQWARRTGLGIDSAGRVIVAACDEQISLRGWAECFARGLSCPNALNLDGGSSTQISLLAGRSKLEWSSGRPVSDAIVIR